MQLPGIDRVGLSRLALPALLFFLCSTAYSQNFTETNKSRIVIPPGQSRPAATPDPKERPREPRERIDAFFALLSRDRVDEAYTDLVKGTIIEEREEDVTTLKDRTQRALDAYGMVRHYEVLNELTAGSSLRRYTCLSLNEELPLRWRFYFYNSARGWKLVDLRVDDGLVELFEEAGRPLTPARQNESGRPE
jgi:hypothetical protein